MKKKPKQALVPKPGKHHKKSRKMRKVVLIIMDMIFAKFNKKLLRLDTLIKKNVRNLRQAKKELLGCENSVILHAQTILGGESGGYNSGALELRDGHDVKLFYCDRRFFSRMFGDLQSTQNPNEDPELIEDNNQRFFRRGHRGMLPAATSGTSPHLGRPNSRKKAAFTKMVRKQMDDNRFIKIRRRSKNRKKSKDPHRRGSRKRISTANKQNGGGGRRREERGRLRDTALTQKNQYQVDNQNDPKPFQKSHYHQKKPTIDSKQAIGRENTPLASKSKTKASRRIQIVKENQRIYDVGRLTKKQKLIMKQNQEKKKRLQEQYRKKKQERKRDFKVPARVSAEPLEEFSDASPSKMMAPDLSPDSAYKKKKQNKRRSHNNTRSRRITASTDFEDFKQNLGAGLLMSKGGGSRGTKARERTQGSSHRGQQENCSPNRRIKNFVSSSSDMLMDLFKRVDTIKNQSLMEGPSFTRFGSRDHHSGWKASHKASAVSKSGKEEEDVFDREADDHLNGLEGQNQVSANLGDGETNHNAETAYLFCDDHEEAKGLFSESSVSISKVVNLKHRSTVPDLSSPPKKKKIAEESHNKDADGVITAQSHLQVIRSSTSSIKKSRCFTTEEKQKDEANTLNLPNKQQPGPHLSQSFIKSCNQVEFHSEKFEDVLKNFEALKEDKLGDLNPEPSRYRNLQPQPSSERKLPDRRQRRELRNYQSLSNKRIQGGSKRFASRSSHSKKTIKTVSDKSIINLKQKFGLAAFGTSHKKLKKVQESGARFERRRRSRPKARNSKSKKRKSTSKTKRRDSRSKKRKVSQNEDKKKKKGRSWRSKAKAVQNVVERLSHKPEPSYRRTPLRRSASRRAGNRSKGSFSKNLEKEKKFKKRRLRKKDGAVVVESGQKRRKRSLREQSFENTVASAVDFGTFKEKVGNSCPRHSSKKLRSSVKKRGKKSMLPPPPSPYSFTGGSTFQNSLQKSKFQNVVLSSIEHKKSQNMTSSNQFMIEDYLEDPRSAQKTQKSAKKPSSKKRKNSEFLNEFSMEMEPQRAVGEQSHPSVSKRKSSMARRRRKYHSNKNTITPDSSLSKHHSKQFLSKPHSLDHSPLFKNPNRGDFHPKMRSGSKKGQMNFSSKKSSKRSKMTPKTLKTGGRKKSHGSRAKVRGSRPKKLRKGASKHRSAETTEKDFSFFGKSSKGVRSSGKKINVYRNQGSSGARGTSPINRSTGRGDKSDDRGDIGGKVSGFEPIDLDFGQKNQQNFEKNQIGFQQGFDLKITPEEVLEPLLGSDGVSTHHKITQIMLEQGIRQIDQMPSKSMFSNKIIFESVRKIDYVVFPLTSVLPARSFMGLGNERPRKEYLPQIFDREKSMMVSVSSLERGFGGIASDSYPTSNQKYGLSSMKKSYLEQFSAERASGMVHRRKSSYPSHHEHYLNSHHQARTLSTLFKGSKSKTANIDNLDEKSKEGFLAGDPGMKHLNPGFRFDVTLIKSNPSLHKAQSASKAGIENKTHRPASQLKRTPRVVEVDRSHSVYSVSDNKSSRRSQKYYTSLLSRRSSQKGQKNIQVNFKSGQNVNRNLGKKFEEIKGGKSSPKAGLPSNTSRSAIHFRAGERASKQGSDCISERRSRPVFRNSDNYRLKQIGELGYGE